jgi:hypothetical protein
MSHIVQLSKNSGKAFNKVHIKPGQILSRNAQMWLKVISLLQTAEWMLWVRRLNQQF